MVDDQSGPDPFPFFEVGALCYASLFFLALFGVWISAGELTLEAFILVGVVFGALGILGYIYYQDQELSRPHPPVVQPPGGPVDPHPLAHRARPPRKVQSQPEPVRPSARHDIPPPRSSSVKRTYGFRKTASEEGDDMVG